MRSNLRELAVVQPGAAQLFFFKIETKRLDQVQRNASIGAQTNNVSGVGRNFRFVENQAEH